MIKFNNIIKFIVNYRLNLQKYSIALEKLLLKENSTKLSKIIKDSYLTFWQLDNFNKIGNKEKFKIYLKYDKFLNIMHKVKK